MFNLSNFKQFVNPTLNFLRKIKCGVKPVFEWVKNNEKDIVLVITIILIVLISFGAGRLTSPKIVQEPVAIEGAPNAAISQSLSQAVVNQQFQNGELTQGVKGLTLQNGKFVASKNSKYYHWPWSPWAKNIKPQNQIWFNSEEEAQKAGYGRSSNFLQYAPAGYE